MSLPLANEQGLAIAPRGAGMGYTGSYVPVRANTLSIDTTRMDKVLGDQPRGHDRDRAGRLHLAGAQRGAEAARAAHAVLGADVGDIFDHRRRAVAAQRHVRRGPSWHLQRKHDRADHGARRWPHLAHRRARARWRYAVLSPLWPRSRRAVLRRQRHSGDQGGSDLAADPHAAVRGLRLVLVQERRGDAGGAGRDCPRRPCGGKLRFRSGADPGADEAHVDGGGRQDAGQGDRQGEVARQGAAGGGESGAGRARFHRRGRLSAACRRRRPQQGRRCRRHGRDPRDRRAVRRRGDREHDCQGDPRDAVSAAQFDPRPGRRKLGADPRPRLAVECAQDVRRDRGLFCLDV